jgi:oxysterol-binding protein 1
LQLNYLSETLREKLPPTDSRLRPDQRALENGDAETAIKKKHGLEEKQRSRRKEMQEANIKHRPSYFEEKIVEETGEIIW